MVLTACLWSLNPSKQDFAGRCHWDTVITWLGCIDDVLSTLSTVHKSSHIKHQALAWNLCLSHLKAHRESLVQACRLSPNYSSKVHSFEASLLYHVNELILEVVKVSQDTTTQSKVEAHSLYAEAASETEEVCDCVCA